MPNKRLIDRIDAITTAAYGEWETRQMDRTLEAVHHLTKALPSLGKVNGRVRFLRIQDSPEESKPLLTYLIQRFQDRSKDWHVRRHVVDTFEKIGEKAVPALIDCLQDRNEDHDLRLAIADALGEIGKKVANVVPALIQCLQESKENSDVCHAATIALEKIREKRVEADSILSQYHKDQNQNSDVRYDTVKVLGELGERAVLKLIQCLKDQTEEQSDRRKAAEILVMEEKAIPTFAQCLQDRNEDWVVRRYAAEALQKWQVEKGLRVLAKEAHCQVITLWRLGQGDRPLYSPERFALASFPLPSTEREALSQRFKSETNIPIRDRVQCIRLKDMGRQEPDIAEVLGVDESTVRDWIALYTEKGLEALCDQK